MTADGGGGSGERFQLKTFDVEFEESGSLVFETFIQAHTLDGVRAASYGGQVRSGRIQVDRLRAGANGLRPAKDFSAHRRRKLCDGLLQPAPVERIGFIAFDEGERAS